MNVNEIFVTDISDPETGVVAVGTSVEIEGRWFDAYGSSKCDPDDDFRYETGLQIALGRALKKLGGKVERAGHKYVAKVDAINAPKLSDEAAYIVGELKVIKASTNDALGHSSDIESIMRVSLDAVAALRKLCEHAIARDVNDDVKKQIDDLYKRIMLDVHGIPSENVASLFDSVLKTTGGRYRAPDSLHEAVAAFDAKVLEFKYQDQWLKLHEVDVAVDGLAFAEGPDMYRVPVGWNP